MGTLGGIYLWQLTICRGTAGFTHTDLTLKVPIMTAADDIYKYFFIVFQKK